MDFTTGAAGVDVFFVISGFIMWVISARTPMGPLDFLGRRALRIAPLYWVTTLAVVLLASAAPELFPAMRLSTAHVLQSLLFLPHRDPNGAPYPVVVPGWTLAYEAFFYLLFAFALWVAPRGRALVASAVLAALVLLGPRLGAAGPAAGAYTDPILLEFAAGLWLGAAFTCGRLPGRWAAFGLLGGGLLAFAAAGALGIDPAPRRLLLWGAPAAAVVAGAVSAERAGLVLPGRSLTRIGDASYSIYLVHGLMVSCAARTLALAGVHGGPAVLVGGVASGLGGGLVCYALVERPIGQALHRVFAPRAARRAAAGPAS